MREDYKTRLTCEELMWRWAALFFWELYDDEQLEAELQMGVLPLYMQLQLGWQRLGMQRFVLVSGDDLLPIVRFEKELARYQACSLQSLLNEIAYGYKTRQQIVLTHMRMVLQSTWTLLRSVSSRFILSVSRC